MKNTNFTSCGCYDNLFYITERSENDVLMYQSNLSSGYRWKIVQFLFKKVCQCKKRLSMQETAYTGENVLIVTSWKTLILLLCSFTSCGCYENLFYIRERFADDSLISQFFHPGVSVEGNQFLASCSWISCINKSWQPKLQSRKGVHFRVQLAQHKS